MANKKKTKKNNIALPIVAAVVIVIAVISVAVPKLTKDNDAAEKTTQASARQVQSTQSTSAQSFAEDIVIDESTITETASFYDYDADGTTIELFAVRASDGTIRLALNTCQVCMGSPYAYFVQQGDNFICQNCMNAFARDSIGTVHGGCNPVPLTEDNYEIQDGKITVAAEFLEQYTADFKNWKKF